MKGFIFLLSSICCVVSTLVVAAVPAPIDVYVSDYAEALTADEQQALRPIASQLKSETGVELAVVIVNRIADYSEAASFEAAATQWFDDWGIGNAERNDGILLLVALEDRAVRIELGAGYGHDHDADMKRIVDGDLLPAFKRSDYALGLTRAVRSLDRFAREWHAEHDASSSWFQRAGNGIAHLFASLWAKLVALAAGGWTIWQLGRRWLRNHPRSCELCNASMVRLSETLDDRYLDAGQKLEERMQTVDYDVWRCTNCQHHLIIDYPALLRRSQRCSKCTRITSEKISRSQIDDQITTTYQCRHCQHQERVYSQVRSNSSNDFGGGRSGGGGASGRW